MSYTVSIQNVEAHPAALAIAVATRAQVVPVMLGLIGKVWDFLRSQGKRGGQNVAIYPFCSPGIRIEAGALVIEPFEPSAEVILGKTPAGRAAMTIHMGAYEHLGRAHSAIREWCEANHHQLQGTNWEIYGHWVADVAEQRTDVYYLLS